MKQYQIKTKEKQKKNKRKTKEKKINWFFLIYLYYYQFSYDREINEVLYRRRHSHHFGFDHQSIFKVLRKQFRDFKECRLP